LFNPEPSARPAKNQPKMWDSNSVARIRSAWRAVAPYSVPSVLCCGYAVSIVATERDISAHANRGRPRRRLGVKRINSSVWCANKKTGLSSSSCHESPVLNGNRPKIPTRRVSGSARQPAAEEPFPVQQERRRQGRSRTERRVHSS